MCFGDQTQGRDRRVLATVGQASVRPAPQACRCSSPSDGRVVPMCSLPLRRGDAAVPERAATAPLLVLTGCLGAVDLAETLSRSCHEHEPGRRLRLLDCLRKGASRQRQPWDRPRCSEARVKTLAAPCRSRHKRASPRPDTGYANAAPSVLLAGSRLPDRVDRQRPLDCGRFRPLGCH